MKQTNGGGRILCAGCLKWHSEDDLRMNNGHPYCVHCFPAVRVIQRGGVEQAVVSDMMRRRP